MLSEAKHPVFIPEKTRFFVCLRRLQNDGRMRYHSEAARDELRRMDGVQYRGVMKRTLALRDDQATIALCAP